MLRQFQQQKLFLRSVLALLLTCSIAPAEAQEFLWSSMFEVASKVYEERDFAKAEKLALEAVEEAQKLPKEGKQLLKSLHLLRLIYQGLNNQDKADEVSARIVALGGGISEDSSKRRPEVKPTQEKPADNKTATPALVDGQTPTIATSAQKPDEIASDRQPKDGAALQFTVETESGKPKQADTKVVSASIGGSNDSVAAPVTRAKELLVMPGHSGWTKSVDVSPDGSQAVSGSVDNTVRLWDLGKGKETGKFEGHDDAVNCVAFSPSGNQILSGSSDKTVRLWDIDSGNEVRKFVGHSNLVTCVAFAPVGTRIASSGYDGVIRVWDSQTGKELAHTAGFLGTVRCLAFTPDGEELVAGGSDKTVTLWRARDGQKIRTFSGHKQEISSLSISLDGTRILSSSRDLTLRVWDLATGEELKCLSGHNNWIVKASFISAEKAISGSLDKTFRIWDLDEGRESHIYSIQHYGMWSLGFSEAGDKAVTGSDDFSLRLWSLK